MNADADKTAMFQAGLQAIKLRRAGMPYTWIAVVMREYHGIDRNPESWRRLCRIAGCPRMPRGHATQFTGREAA